MSIFNKKTENQKKTPAVKKEVKASTKELYSEAPAATGEKHEVKYDQAYRILVKPLITEKASIAGSLNKYVFQVAGEANKVEVAKAIEKVYGIKPVRVNIVNVGGKKVRYGKMQGKRKDWRKAIITLPEGKTIKVYEGV